MGSYFPSIRPSYLYRACPHKVCGWSDTETGHQPTAGRLLDFLGFSCFMYSVTLTNAPNYFTPPAPSKGLTVTWLDFVLLCVKPKFQLIASFRYADRTNNCKTNTKWKHLQGAWSRHKMANPQLLMSLIDHAPERNINRKVLQCVWALNTITIIKAVCLFTLS